MEYTHLIQTLDLEFAGDFILMAATLMQIKAAMLLPREESPLDGEEVLDPRRELVQKLLEYKRFKDAANKIHQLSEEQKNVLYRQVFDFEYEEAKNRLNYSNATLGDLLAAFKKALERLPEEQASHLLKHPHIPIEAKMIIIDNRLKESKRIRFSELVAEATRPHLIAFFLAILEMIRQRRINIFQSEQFADILISEYEHEMEATEEMNI